MTMRLVLLTQLLFTICMPICLSNAQLPLHKVGQLADELFLGTDETYRSVQLRAPFVYALERNGDLHVFRLPRNPIPEFAAGLFEHFGAPLPHWLQVLRTTEPATLERIVEIESAGNGDDLELLGKQLFLTSRGGLSVYSVEDPAKPKHISIVGELDTDFQSIVRTGDSVFVLGKGHISSFEYSDMKLHYICTLENECRNWNGHFDGRFLYVSETSRARTGIAVYDATDPASIKEKYFLKTPRLAYHVFMNHDDHLICCIDSESRFHSVSSDDITVAGSVMVYKTSAGAAPKLVATHKKAGGRTATAFSLGDKTILLCNGVAFESKLEKMESCFKFFPDGSTLDGAPYGSDCMDQYSVITTDSNLTLFRIGKPCGFVAGAKAGRTIRWFMRLIAP